MTGTETSPEQRRWWQQPSLHFLFIGVVLFGAFQWMQTRQGADGKKILVDRNALLTYMQYRARAFEPARSAETLDRLDENDLAALVDDYVREEVLYREALALGLDRNDFVIRQRLIQKLEFINRDLTEEMTELSDDEIQRYFTAHRDRYTQPARITFTHIFLDSHVGGGEASREDSGETGPDDAGEAAPDRAGEAARDAVMSRAESLLADLNARQVLSLAAGQYGDDFADGAELVEQSPGEIVSSFGQQFSEEIFALEANPDRWQGPLQSPHGFHLLLITESIPEQMLELAEVEKAVREDARRDRIEERNQDILQEIVDAYDVQVTFRPGPSTPPGEASGAQQ